MTSLPPLRTCAPRSCANQMSPEPINPWKIRERKRHDDQQAFFMECLQNTRRKVEKGQQRACFTKSYLETAEKSSISGDYEASCVIGMMALVGIFTVTGPIYKPSHLTRVY